MLMANRWGFPSNNKVKDLSAYKIHAKVGSFEEGKV
jgi:hypothetical protein